MTEPALGAEHTDATTGAVYRHLGGGTWGQVAIRCPVCGRTSWHPQDVLFGYCGACHDYTSEASPLPRSTA